MSEKLTVTATGDSLFIADFPQEYLSGEFKEISGYIKACDVKLTNLETNLSDFEFYPNQYSGGTWLNTRRKYFPYLKDYGFDFYGNANNHCYDYGPNGLMSTIKTLDEEGVLHAGTGESLEAAGRPAVFVRNGKKIAVSCNRRAADSVPIGEGPFCGSADQTDCAAAARKRSAVSKTIGGNAYEGR